MLIISVFVILTCIAALGSARKICDGSESLFLPRQLKVVDYADEFTKDKEQHVQEATFGLIKPGHMQEMGTIIGMPG